jgi:hypothetical protein
MRREASRVSFLMCPFVSAMLLLITTTLALAWMSEFSVHAETASPASG